jgi:hypothetical protein
MVKPHERLGEILATSREVVTVYVLPRLNDSGSRPKEESDGGSDTQ